MKWINGKLKKYWEIIIIGFLSFTPLWWLRHGSVILGHDSGYRFSEAGILSQLFYSWNPVLGIGMDWSIFKAFLLTQAPEAFFIQLFGFPVGQRITLILWFFIIGFSWWLAIKLIFPEAKYWIFRLWCAFLACFNFFILQGWFITERAKFSLFAALPLAIAIVIKTFYGSLSLLKGTLFFSLLFFFLNGGGSPPLYGGVLVGVGMTFLSLFIVSVFQRRWTQVRRSITMLLLFLFSFVLFNAYWIVPQYFLAKNTYKTSVASEGGIEGLIAWEKEIGKNSSFLNLIRLEGIPDWYSESHAFSKTYIQNPLFIVFSCVPILFVAVGLLMRLPFREKGERRMFLLLLLVLLPIGLFFTSGSHPPTGNIYLFLLRKIPGFLIFRSSFYKFAPVVWLPIIVLSGYVFSRIVLSLRNRLARIVLSTIALIGILFYHYPYFVSDFFRFLPDFSTRVVLPPYINDAAKEMQTLPKTSRILLVPPLSYGYYGTRLDTYNWGYFSLDMLPRNISGISVVTNDKLSTPWIDTAYRVFESGNKEETMKYISALGITHVLSRGDVQFNKDASDVPDTFLYERQAEEYFGKPVWERGVWKLFTLPAPSFSKVSASSQYACGAGDRSVGTLIAANITPITDRCDEMIDIPHVIEPTCFMCKTGEYEQFVNAARIPIVRNDFFSEKLRAWKEKKAVRRSEGNIGQMIDVRLSIAQNRLGIVSGATDKKSVFQSYVQLMNEVASLTESLDGESGNTYRVRITAYVDAQISFIETFTDTEQIVDEMRSLQREMQKNIWMGDGKKQYRYGVTMPKGMQGVVYGAEQCEFTQLDDMKNPSRSQIFTSGYHTMEFICDNVTDAPPIAVVEHLELVHANDTPTVSDTYVNPTEYRVSIKNMNGQFLFRFNEGYHTGWKVIEATKNASVRIKNHMKVDGYANGWIVTGVGDTEFRIIFAPQSYFYDGALISIVALLISVLLYVKNRKKAI